MKKTYIQPTIEIIRASAVSFICGSQDITSNLNIGYGGVDENGKKEADSRYQKFDVWEEDEGE